jgi:hypothetical protein
MANRLLKLADVKFTPAIPYQPAVPGYWYLVEVSRPGTWVYVGPALSRNYVRGFGVSGFRSTLSYRPNGTVQELRFAPSVPALPGRPASTTYTAIVGWNAGGRSIESLAADGSFQFNVGPNPIGVVVGLVNQDLSTLPTDQSHAFYVQGTTVSVLERGVEVATVPTTHNEATPFVISRSGLQVTYKYGAWEYVSATPSFDAVYLDTSFYFTGDFVENPSIEVGADVSGSAIGTLRAIDGIASDAISTSLVQLVGYGSVSRLTGYASLSNDSVGVAAGSLGRLSGLAADGFYAQADGVIAALNGEALGGFDLPAFVFGYGVIPSVIGAAVCLVGGVGTVESSVKPLDALAADYPMNYGQASGTLQPLFGAQAYLIDPALDTPITASGALLGDYFFVDYREQAFIRDAVELRTAFTARVSVTDAIFDALDLRDTLTFQQFVQAVIRDRMAISGDHKSAQAAAIQYAVNVLTGAPTTYQGFAFDSFASAAGSVYATDSTGLYRVRPGDDNGSPISVELDFGATDFGTPNAKVVETVYLGVTTDGEVLLRANRDGDDSLYRVVQRGPIMRALLAKGSTGRRWNLALEVVDATHFELDLVEIMVGVSTRRWMR